MAREDRDKPLWDPEDAIGVVPNGNAYRWSHGWAVYVAVMCGMLGVFAMLGAVVPFSLARVAGAVGILAGTVTIRRSDKASRTSARDAFLWFLATAALAVGGASLWLSTA